MKDLDPDFQRILNETTLKLGTSQPSKPRFPLNQCQVCGDNHSAQINFNMKDQTTSGGITQEDFEKIIEMEIGFANSSDVERNIKASQACHNLHLNGLIAELEELKASIHEDIQALTNNDDFSLHSKIALKDIRVKLSNRISELKKEIK